MKNRKYMYISIIATLIVWTVVAEIVKNSITVPSPYATLEAFKIIVTSPRFYVQVLSTLERALFGFSIAFFGGLILGIGAGVSEPLFYWLRPMVLAQRSIPTMAIILLAIIWLTREGAPILVSVLVIFPIIYGAVVNGIRNVDQSLLEMTKVYHFGKGRMLKHLYLPSIRSSLGAVAGTAISLNLKITIAAEILSQPGEGIGTGFQMEKVAFNTAGVFAWAMIAVLLAGLLELLVSERLWGFLSRSKQP